MWLERADRFLEVVQRGLQAIDQVRRQARIGEHAQVRPRRAGHAAAGGDEPGAHEVPARHVQIGKLRNITQARRGNLRDRPHVLASNERAEIALILRFAAGADPADALAGGVDLQCGDCRVELLPTRRLIDGSNGRRVRVQKFLDAEADVEDCAVDFLHKQSPCVIGEVR
jgi:hypothetical protein